MKPFFLKIHWVLSSQLGLNFKFFILSLWGLPIYLRDFFIFRKNFSGRIEITPCLHDRYEQGGDANSEYFWQDLLVAREIFANNPAKHVDIGSRVDGFVAHVASFRQIEVFDIRPISSCVPGITFRQANLMSEADTFQFDGLDSGGYCDSLSCLHALEHFGLGRYGDPLNPQGYFSGIVNMSRLVGSGGVFYLSTPIGNERVQFNANWVFDPLTIVKSVEAQGMSLKKLTIISSGSGYQESGINHEDLLNLASKSMQLGLFTFIKN